MAAGVDQVVSALVAAQCYSATKYVSPREVIRATHPRYASRKKQWDRRDNRLDLRLTIGAPNYYERAFIKKLKAAGEPFPVRKIQLRPFPEPR